MTSTVLLRRSTVELLDAAALDPEQVSELVGRALDEDLAGGTDATTAATVPAGRTDTADLVARAGGVVAGLPVATAVFDIAGRTARSEEHTSELQSRPHLVCRLLLEKKK